MCKIELVRARTYEKRTLFIYTILLTLTKNTHVKTHVELEQSHVIHI
jgi:hypothetical protein